MARKDGSTLRGRQKPAQRATDGRSRYSKSFEDFIKRVFATYYGEEPPWTCHFCGGDIVELGMGKWSLHRHHVNGDRTDNSFDNLVPTHKTCHNSHHATERNPARERSELGRYL